MFSPAAVLLLRYTACLQHMTNSRVLVLLFVLVKPSPPYPNDPHGVQVQHCGTKSHKQQQHGSGWLYQCQADNTCMAACATSSTAAANKHVCCQVCPSTGALAAAAHQSGMCPGRHRMHRMRCMAPACPCRPSLAWRPLHRQQQP